jgi:hypothetical protein
MNLSRVARTLLSDSAAPTRSATPPSGNEGQRFRAAAQAHPRGPVIPRVAPDILKA